MKRFLLVTLLISISLSALRAQQQLPPYHEVVNKFFTLYNPSLGDYETVNFAKKRTGWYVQIVNQLKNDSLIDEQYFWAADSGAYLPLKKWTGEVSPDNLQRTMNEYMGGSRAYSWYNYERCRYYGYEGWDKDMINELASIGDKSDTLVEGLARAYSFLASHYLWSQYGGKPIDSETLGPPPGRMGKPSEERIKVYADFLEKSIEYYRRLVAQNPDYQTMVGTSPAKLFNEEFHLYYQVNMAGYPEEADKYFARITPNQVILTQGKNYLAACPPNSILITNGDNDTYPLLYVQKKEGYRTDVTVLNSSLMGLAPFLEFIKREGKVKFSSTADYFGSSLADYAFINEVVPKPPPVILPRFISEIQSGKNKVAGPDGRNNNTYNVRTVSMPVDLVKFAKIGRQPYLSPKFDVELGNYLLMNDFITLDILATNLYTRPLLFTYEFRPLSKTLVRNGPNLQLLPLNPLKHKLADSLSGKGMETYLSTQFKPVFAQKNEGRDFNVIPNAHPSQLYASVISQYLNKNKKTQAAEWAKKWLGYYGKEKMPFSFVNTQYATLLAQAGFKKEATTLLEDYMETALEIYQHPQATQLYISRTFLLDILREAFIIFEVQKLQEQKLHDLKLRLQVLGIETGF